MIDRLSIGGGVYYYSWKWSGATESSTEFGFGPYIRYYIPITEKALVDITGLFQYYSWKNPGDTDNSSQILFGGSGGITYLITTNLGVGGSFGIVYSPDYKDQGTKVTASSYTQIIIGLGFTV